MVRVCHRNSRNRRRNASTTPDFTRMRSPSRYEYSRVSARIFASDGCQWTNAARAGREIRFGAGSPGLDGRPVRSLRRHLQGQYLRHQRVRDSRAAARSACAARELAELHQGSGDQTHRAAARQRPDGERRRILEKPAPDDPAGVSSHRASSRWARRLLLPTSRC